MTLFRANKTRFLGAASLLGGALISGALFSGCNRSAPDSGPTMQTVALAQTVETPTPQPSPTPRPTAKPKGIALTGMKTDKKVFALTFDDGPDPSYTPKILKILKQKNVPATFFMVGEMVKWHGPTAKLVKAAGHPIGNHTWSHPKRTKSPRTELDRTDAIIKRELGVTPQFFRPPYGILGNGLAAVASANGQDVIIWTSDSDDWNRKTDAARIKSNVLKNLAPGGIALMHDGGGNRSATVAALPGIIDAIKNRGYELVTVPEIMAIGTPETVHIGPKTRRPKPKKSAAKKPLAKKGAKVAPPIGSSAKSS